MPGIGAPDPDLRDPDPATNNTVLSGEIDGNAADFENDAFHVVTALTITSSTELSGFTIRDGNSRGNVGFGGGHVHLQQFQQSPDHGCALHRQHGLQRGRHGNLFLEPDPDKGGLL